MNQTEKLTSDGMPVFIFGGTNRPWDLDPAVVRRFNARLFVQSPSKDDRIQLIKNIVQPCLFESNLEELAKDSSGCTFQEIIDMICEVVRDKFLQDLKSNYFVKKELLGYLCNC